MKVSSSFVFLSFLALSATPSCSSFIVFFFSFCFSFFPLLCFASFFFNNVAGQHFDHCLVVFCFVFDSERERVNGKAIDSSALCLTEDGAFSSCKEDHGVLLLSALLSSRRSMVCCLGFVPAGSVSSSSTLKSLCPPVYLLCHFPSLRHAQDSTPTGDTASEGRYRIWTPASHD